MVSELLDADEDSQPPLLAKAVDELAFGFVVATRLLAVPGSLPRTDLEPDSEYFVELHGSFWCHKAVDGPAVLSTGRPDPDSESFFELHGSIVEVVVV